MLIQSGLAVVSTVLIIVLICAFYMMSYPGMKTTIAFGGISAVVLTMCVLNYQDSTKV